jgi:V8-like Glu-specific endopeptidase
MRKRAFVAGLVLSTAAYAGCTGRGHSTTCAETTSAIADGTIASEYAEAVLVDAYKGGKINTACSGALIAPDVVLTAAHCVDSFDAWHVTAPYASAQKATSKRGETYDWQGAGSETVTPNRHDIGLIYLSAPIALTDYPDLADKPLAAGGSLVNIGRIRNGKLSFSELYVSSELQVEPGDRYGYPFDYAAGDVIEGGDSGGPAEIALGGRHSIVAVNSSAASQTEMLARVDLVRDWIQTQMDALRGPLTPASSAQASSTSGAASPPARDAGAADATSGAGARPGGPSPDAPASKPSSAHSAPSAETSAGRAPQSAPVTAPSKAPCR